MTYGILNFEHVSVGMTQIVTHGVNTSVFGRKLNTGVTVSSTPSWSGHGSYSACYSRETGGEGRSRSLEIAYAQPSFFEADDCWGLH